MFRQRSLRFLPLIHHVLNTNLFIFKEFGKLIATSTHSQNEINVCRIHIRQCFRLFLQNEWKNSKIKQNVINELRIVRFTLLTAIISKQHSNKKKQRKWSPITFLGAGSLFSASSSSSSSSSPSSSSSSSLQAGQFSFFSDIDSHNFSIKIIKTSRLWSVCVICSRKHSSNLWSFVASSSWQFLWKKTAHSENAFSYRKKKKLKLQREAKKYFQIKWRIITFFGTDLLSTSLMPDKIDQKSSGAVAWPHALPNFRRNSVWLQKSLRNLDISPPKVVVSFSIFDTWDWMSSEIRRSTFLHNLLNTFGYAIFSKYSSREKIFTNYSKSSKRTMCTRWVCATKCILRSLCSRSWTLSIASHDEILKR